MPATPLPSLRGPIDLSELLTLSKNASHILEKVRGLMLSPSANKQPPTFNTRELARLCNIEPEYVNLKVQDGELPQGKRIGKSNRRVFTLAEARIWVRALRESLPRPKGAKAATVAIGNFKGGVAKTTTTMALAQGLSLRGYRVLVIDMDPQGSLTTLFGVIPDSEVGEDNTVGPLLYGHEDSLRYAVHESYWDGIDFVPGNTHLFNAEFILPSQQVKDSTFEFWNVLNKGLDDVRDLYDVILIDTAPALSYLTINALMAADGLIVPLPPSALDFASSVQFWNLFADLTTRLNDAARTPKAFDFVNVLLTRVDPTDEAAVAVREWILKAYGDKVLPVEIPKTAVALAASAEFGTVYDITKYEGDARTYRRARSAYDKFSDVVDQILVQRWANQ